MSKNEVRGAVRLATAAATLLESVMPPSSASRHGVQIPSLWLRGHYFYCDGEALSFRQAGRKLALLKAFLATKGYRLPRAQVIARVYGEGQGKRRSARFIACLNMNMLRTISDTRRQLYVSFAHLHPGIDWLPFNRETKDWQLLRFKEDYVLAQLHPKIY